MNEILLSVVAPGYGLTKVRFCARETSRVRVREQERAEADGNAIGRIYACGRPKSYRRGLSDGVEDI